MIENTASNLNPEDLNLHAAIVTAPVQADNDVTPDPAPLPAMRTIPDPRATGLYATEHGQIVRLVGSKAFPLAPYWARTKQTLAAGAYLRVDVTLPDGSRWRPRVHTVIASAWHGPRPTPEHVARHLSDDRTDNRPANVAWGTQADNQADARKNGRRRTALTPELVTLLREAHARIGGTADETIDAVEEVHGALPCSRSTAHAAIFGRTWRHLPMPVIEAEDDVPASDIPATLPTGLNHASVAVAAGTW